MQDEYGPETGLYSEIFYILHLCLKSYVYFFGSVIIGKIEDASLNKRNLSQCSTGCLMKPHDFSANAILASQVKYIREIMLQSYRRRWRRLRGQNF